MIRHLALALQSAPADAQSRRLDGPEIADLLSGNTALGEWEGTPFRQHYRTDGTTIWTNGGAPTEGLWQVTEGAYEESRDGGESWRAWTVRRVAGRLLFLGEGMPTTPFTVEQGDTSDAEG